jgi:hypothetical protein
LHAEPPEDVATGRSGRGMVRLVQGHPAGPPISMAHPGDAAGHQGALTMAGGVTGRLRPRSAAAPRSCLVREPEWRPGGRCRNRETSKPGALTKLSHQRCRILTGMQRLIRRGGQKSREIEAGTRLLRRPHQPCDRHAPPRDLHSFPPFDRIEQRGELGLLQAEACGQGLGDADAVHGADPRWSSDHPMEAAGGWLPAAIRSRDLPRFAAAGLLAVDDLSFRPAEPPGASHKKAGPWGARSGGVRCGLAKARLQAEPTPT